MDHSSIGKKIEPRYWNKPQGKVKKHESATSLNSLLNSFSRKILKVATELQDQDIAPTHDRVNAAFRKSLIERLPEAHLTRSIIYQWKDYLKSKQNTVKPITYSNQTNSLEALEAFLQEEKIETLRPEAFTIRHLMRWQDYLNGKHASNTVAKRLKHFKSFLKYYQELGGQTGLNLSKLKYRETEGIKIYLTQEELEAFQETPLSGRPDQVRDLFVLQCNTGLRISDLKRLDKNIEGNRIALTTKKTNVKLEIPITPAIRAILKKYSYQLPQIPEPKINLGIKDIYKSLFPDNSIQVRKGNEFETVYKWSLISTHDAIRTFITISAERGMNVSAISKITGKSIPVLLKHYLSQSQKVADKEFEKAWGSSPLRIAK